MYLVKSFYALRLNSQKSTSLLKMNSLSLHEAIDFAHLLLEKGNFLIGATSALNVKYSKL